MNKISTPLDLKSLKITDSFWKKEMELVRKEVIPYQWEALNDRVKDAAPRRIRNIWKTSFMGLSFRTVIFQNGLKRLLIP